MVASPPEVCHTDGAVAELAWVERIRAGDEGAFEDLFFAYYRSLCTYVGTLVRSESVAEEIAQDILMNVWQDRTRWHVQGSVRAYLFGAARNRALNCARDRKVVDRWETLATRQVEISGMGQGPAPVEQRVIRTELQAAFERGMQDLPERQRQAFSLRWTGQLSHAEIAQVMGISVKAVEFNLTRAFRTLRETLAAYL